MDKHVYMAEKILARKETFSVDHMMHRCESADTVGYFTVTSETCLERPLRSETTCLEKPHIS